MKHIHLLYLFVAGISLISSCKKDDKDSNNTATPNYTYVGIWNGKYGSGTATPTSSYGMVFFSNNRMNAYDGLAGTSSIATGSFSVYATDSIKGYYQYISGGSSFYFRGKLNTERSHIDGRWGSDSFAMNGGTFYLDK